MATLCILCLYQFSFWSINRAGTADGYTLFIQYFAIQVLLGNAELGPLMATLCIYTLYYLVSIDLFSSINSDGTADGYTLFIQYFVIKVLLVNTGLSRSKSFFLMQSWDRWWLHSVFIVPYQFILPSINRAGAADGYTLFIQFFAVQVLFLNAELGPLMATLCIYSPLSI